MARKSNSRAAQGAGTIRKKTVTRNGAAYTYWEARITTGMIPALAGRSSAHFQAKPKKRCEKRCRPRL